MQKIISQFIFIIALFFSFTFEGMASPASSAFEYVKPNEYSHVTVSPNGKYAAFTRTITNKFCLDRFRTSIAKSQNCSENAKEYRSTQEVLIYDLLQNRVDQTIDIPVNVHVSWLKFGNDTRILISLSSFRTTGRMNRFSTTVAQDIILSASIGPDKDNYEPIELTALGGVGVASRSGSTIGVYLGAWLGSPEIYNIANDDPTYVIARTGGRFGQLKRVSIYEDVSRDIAKADKKTFHWLLDSKGKPKVRVACDRKDKCENIETFYLNENGDWALIYELKESKADGYITEVFYPFDIDETTGELLVVSRTGNEKRTSLKRFDPIRRQFTELVYSHPIYDIENLLFDSNSNKLVGGIIQSDKSEYFITEPELKTHYDALATQFDEDQNFWIVDNNVSGSRAMIYVSSPHSTGKYYIYDPKTKKAAFAIDQNSFLSKRLESDGQALKIAMRDGAAVDAYRYFPKNQNKGAPLIIMPHGGPHLRDYFVYDGWVQYFVSRGYQVLQVNFRGSSGYGVDHEVAGYGQWGGLMQDDITDAVKFMHSKGYATPEKTCVVGYSYGGYAALYGGGSTPELYACIVSGGGVADLVRSMKDDRVRLDDQSYALMKNSMGDPRDTDFLKEKSPTNLADNFTAPVLLIHGERDNRVPNLHSRRMRDALKKADKSVTYIELEEEGHDGWSLDSEIFYLETIDAFLKAHIGR